MRIDFHSHILPEMDDGAKSLEISKQQLEILAKDKVDAVVLTPHFYRHDEKIDSFLSRRQKAYEKLLTVTNEIENCPELYLGAEVYFYRSLSSDPLFDSLAIADTGYVLIELPFEKLTDKFFDDFADFYANCDHRIIIAHIERLFSFGNKPKDLERIFSYKDIICQMNCSSIVSAGFFERKKHLSLLNSGHIGVIGTDTHNVSSRPPEYASAEKIIRKKCGDELFESICQTSERILRG